MKLFLDSDDGLWSARFDEDSEEFDDFLVERSYHVNGELVPLIGIDVSQGGGPTYTMTQEKVAELLPVLRRFMNTGTIAEGDKDSLFSCQFKIHANGGEWLCGKSADRIVWRIDGSSMTYCSEHGKAASNFSGAITKWLGIEQ